MYTRLYGRPVILYGKPIKCHALQYFIRYDRVYSKSIGLLKMLTRKIPLSIGLMKKNAMK